MAHLGTPEELRCPVCGVGVLADINYDDAPPTSPSLQQQPESRQVDRYTCGHEVPRAELESADRSLDVERRQSDESAAPLPDDGEG
jgi:hypothetical protein